MLEAKGPNAQQISYWNEVSGPKWVRLDATINALITPLGDRALEAAGASPGERVLDAGCGCGRTTLELARRVGAEGEVLGIDISAPMLAEANARLARAQVANAAFINADAQTHAFGGDPFDLVFSRFGVMFFAEPERAFGNLRTALRPGGRLVFICWREMERNPWMTLAVKAVARHVEPPPPAAPGAPGPFALSDRERIVAILKSAGFAEIGCKPIESAIDVAAGAPLDATVEFLSQMGPAGALLNEAAPEVRQAARKSIHDALAPHYNEGRVELGAATWIVSATAQT